MYRVLIPIFGISNVYAKNIYSICIDMQDKFLLYHVTFYLSFSIFIFPFYTAFHSDWLLSHHLCTDNLTFCPFSCREVTVVVSF